MFESQYYAIQYDALCKDTDMFIMLLKVFKDRDDPILEPVKTELIASAGSNSSYCSLTRGIWWQKLPTHVKIFLTVLFAKRLHL